MKSVSIIFLLNSKKRFYIYNIPLNVHPVVGRSGMKMFSLHHPLQSTGGHVKAGTPPRRA